MPIHPSSTRGDAVPQVTTWISVLSLLTLPACTTTQSAPAGPAAAPPPAPVYRDRKAPVEVRVADLLAQMTPQEKALMLAGSGWMESYPIPRLGIPAIKMADGPLGVRNWSGSSALAHGAPIHTTAFPAGIAAAATWDTEIVRSQGRVVAEEVKALGRDMILGPTVNIHRTPLWGRNFEGYGEDPYLAARMAVAYVEGVQGEGVIATVKHFAANNQEYERHRIDEEIDLRALHEIYFPAFKAAVREAGVYSVMSAYNKVNGQWCSENPLLLSETLRKSWGFQGFVVSDWGSTYSTVGPIHAGMDLEMPGGEPMRRWTANTGFAQAGNGAGWLTGDKVTAALSSGQVEQGEVDESVRRILRVLFLARLFDEPHAGGGQVDTPEQRAVARTAATEGVVLLKNDGGLLPLAPGRLRVAVIGPSAQVARTGGGGSSRVTPSYAISPLQGLREVAGSEAQVTFALGTAMEGEGVTAAGEQERAAALAGKSEVAIVVVGNAPGLESEDFDRTSMDLPAGQDALIEAVAAANKKTIVVVLAGAPVAMTRWISRVPALVYGWYGGQEVGHALADVIFGVANPSGKTPVTFPKRIEDSTAYGNYPGEALHVAYREGIYVGYRGFDKRNVEPLFPFGHGLSYTTFKYQNLKVVTPVVKKGESAEITVEVQNSGTRAGAEVVELYVHDAHASVDRPTRELKGFRRVMLEPGETKTVSFVVDAGAMSFFHPVEKSWVVEPGDFEVDVGASSRDIRARGVFRVE
jgi:beta-glucosidase